MEMVGSLYDCVAKANGVTSDENYGSDGTLTVLITCDLDKSKQLREALVDSTRGEATFQDS